MSPLPNSWELDKAVIGVLQNDATLKGLVPDGVFKNEAPPGSKRFVIVSVPSGIDRGVFGRRGYELRRYMVQAVGLTTMMTLGQANSAGYRIDVLLQDATLTAATYPATATLSRISPIDFDEVDEIDASIRWYHRGGHYLLHGPHDG